MDEADDSAGDVYARDYSSYSRKRPANVYDAIEQGQYIAGKRQVRQRTVLNHEGDAMLVADLDQPPPATGGGKGGGASGARAARTWENCGLCQLCWDGGDLIMCDYCPVSMCFLCAGINPSALGPSWRCRHHSCATCGRKAHAAGGLLFRCAECPQAYCEDCLPRESRVINESARFHSLGFACPKSACYVLCSERCATLAREHATRGV